MNGHKSGKQVRIQPKALGLGAILAGAILATSATAALAMPARRIDATFRPIVDATFRQEVFNSLSGVTQWASKVAVDPEIYLGIDDGLIDTSWVIVPARAFSSVPHQVAPI